MSKYLKIENKAKNKVVINIVGYIGNRWWRGEEDEDTVVSREELNQELKDLGAIDADEIELNIDSLGGDPFHSTAMYNILAKLKATKTVNYIGHSASSATHFLGLGKVRAAENVTLLMHEATSGMWGNADDMRALGESLDNISGTLANGYAKKSGMTPEESRSMMKRGNGNGIWDTAQEWLELGLIDEIYEPTKAVACVDNNTFKNYRLPESEIIENKSNSDDNSELIVFLDSQKLNLN